MQTRLKFKKTNQTDKKVKQVNKVSRSGILSNLLEISKKMLAEKELDKAITIAINQVIQITNAEHGMIILFKKNGELLFEKARNLDNKDIEHPIFEISRTIIDTVRTNGKPVYLHNALEDPVFKKSKSVDRLKILSIICLPLTYQNKIFGVVYLDNRTVRGAFESETFQFTQNFTDLISLISFRALEQNHLTKQVTLLEQQLRAKYDFESIIGHSTKMMEILQILSQVADTDVPILIEGETGTGKELVARAVHFNSKRREAPLVCVNCGAIPENLLESEFFGHEKGAFTGAFKHHSGKFEQAEGGTIFLDEIDEMSPTLQVKLLRVLQWGEFNPLGSEKVKQCDVRIVAASKTNLLSLVNDGKFRDDLYYRLNLIRMELPPLRERREDILLLADYFFENISNHLNKKAPVLSSTVRQIIKNYQYPGNIRELENIIKRAVILCTGNTIEIEHLPPEVKYDHIGTISQGGKFSLGTFQDNKKEIIENFERNYLQIVLAECKGVVRKAAQKAGMHEKNFYSKLNKYGFQPRTLNNKSK